MIESKLKGMTNQYQDVSTIISDMMFKFRSINRTGSLTLYDVCCDKAKQTVRSPVIKYQTADRVFTAISLFDRRADKTKGSTKKKRGEQSPTALVYRGEIEINFDEKFINYSSLWKDQEFGRKKISTAFTKLFGSDGNIKAVGLPSRARHIVIGGERNLCQAYEIDCHGFISHLSTTGYNSNHPEADTGVFYSLYSYLEQHGSSNSPQTIIIDCPETDCGTIVLYKNTKIRQLLTRNSVKLFCKLHDQLIDQTGKKAKEPKKRVSIEEQRVRSEGYYVILNRLVQQ